MRVLEHEIVYRGEEAIEKISKIPLVVCGAGAIGSNLVDNMVRQGFRNISVIDDDRIEDHNRHTQIWQRRDVGSLKVAALKNHCFNTMQVSITPQQLRLSEGTTKKLLPSGSLVIDGFDNSSSRQVVQDYCRSQGIECLHVGLAENYAEVVWDEHYRVPGDPQTMDVCEYPLARNTVMLAVTVATEVILRYVIAGVKEQYTLTLKDFKITSKEV